MTCLLPPKKAAQDELEYERLVLLLTQQIQARVLSCPEDCLREDADETRQFAAEVAQRAQRHLALNTRALKALEALPLDLTQEGVQRLLEGLLAAGAVDPVVPRAEVSAVAVESEHRQYVALCLRRACYQYRACLMVVDQLQREDGVSDERKAFARQEGGKTAYALRQAEVLLASVDSMSKDALASLLQTLGGYPQGSTPLGASVH
jgi:hypothetical protein